MTPAFACLVAAFNTGSNTLNTALSVWSLTSQAPAVHGASPWAPLAESAFPLSFYVGLALYAAGITVELTSELQRKRFKSKPENAGKPYGGGLFSWATNINYGGYTLWRTGYALVCGGWPWAVFVGAGQAYDFVTRAIPSMDRYTTAKYGDEWVRIRQHVRWRLLPCIY